MKAPLYLSPRNASTAVCVPAYITDNLQTYHITAIRFIYASYMKGSNVLISNDDGMNEPLVVCAFLAAINKFPVCIICEQCDLIYWQYELECQGRFKVIIASENTCLDEVQDVVLVTQHNLKYVQNLYVYKWAFVVLHILENTKFNSLYLRRIKNDFYIGIVHVNSFPDLNKDFSQKILKWAKHKENLLEKLWSYPEHWLRLTWCSFECEKPSKEEQLIYKSKLQSWNQIKSQEDVTNSENIFNIHNSNFNVDIENTFVQMPMKRKRRRKNVRKNRRSKSMKLHENETEKVKDIHATLVESCNQSHDNILENSVKVPEDTDNIPCTSKEKLLHEENNSNMKKIFANKSENVENPILNSLIDASTDNKSKINTFRKSPDFPNNESNSVLDSLLSETSSTKSFTAGANLSAEDENPILNSFFCNS